MPVNSPVFGLTVNATVTANIRRTPNGEDIGDIPRDTLLTAFERTADDLWRRVQWRCDSTSNQSLQPTDSDGDTGGCPEITDAGDFTVKYGWIARSVTAPTTTFPARNRFDGLNVYPNKTVNGVNQPDMARSPIGELRIVDMITVTATWDGWYQFAFADPVTGTVTTNAWCRGWYTAGRQ